MEKFYTHHRYKYTLCRHFRRGEEIWYIESKAKNMVTQVELAFFNTFQIKKLQLCISFFPMMNKIDLNQYFKKNNNNV